ncbi:hypothetical protein FGO68_gene398 [Halteria grandinella]|uniref:Protein kinase domain-containing protein n=1 Tax=Halteria grandinella TaxID=5974 RepID=A0A8J8NTW6_HALGN|nr:hypothetical protein FGO68_gene398 [Halteria grandinella]
MDFASSQVYGNYKILSKLGQGSYSHVYLAELLNTNLRYALKVQKQKKNKEKMKRSNQIFENEIAFYNRIKHHPFLIKYIESFECHGTSKWYSPFCIVFEYKEGCDAHKKMTNPEEEIPEQLGLTWFTQAALGLAHVHSNGCMHRDIKPANIIIAGGSIGGIARLCDFGSTKEDNQGAENTINAGTQRYFPPEKLFTKGDLPFLKS